MKKIISLSLACTLLSTNLVGCSDNSKLSIIPGPELSPPDTANYLDFDFEVDPITFKLSIEANNKMEIISDSLPPMEVSNLIQTEDTISWVYPDEQINVSLSKEANYLEVNLESTSPGENAFTWPKISAPNYILPLHEGKWIPQTDPYWLDYLSQHSEFNVMESFSMQFFSVAKEEYAVTYIMNNPFNNTLNFNTTDAISFDFTHEYPSINPNKTYGFKIYVTDNNITEITNVYKTDRIEKGLFKTLSEKAQENPNITKLYGAPHIYFWDKSIITVSDIKWNLFSTQFPKPLTLWIQQLLSQYVEDGQEMVPIFDEIQSQDYIDNYQKNQIVKALNAVMQLKEFYSQEVFTSLTPELNTIVSQGIETLNRVELIEFNKKLLESQMGSMTSPASNWASYNTLSVLDEMKESGLTKAWIGFDDIESGYLSPLLVQKANDYGYLVGPYDSYHSIHKPGEEKWSTAQFKDPSLYETATITDKNGEKLSGFQNVGRKLNPTLSLPSVEERLSDILDYDYAFNSWFMDVDAAGEVHDDYSPEHITTQSEDLAARLKRMDYIKDTANVVIGSEGGNDYASTTIAFAHGLETPAFSWVDPDMKRNKESEYYVGRYYSPTGGVPEVFAKQVPLKELYNKIFISPEYSLPLFKLVYNDSIISSYQWLWGTFKIQDEVSTRMLREVLYNTPPMYHIDRTEWDKHKEKIVSHNKVWIDFNEKAITQEMTNFEVLTPDRLVQLTEFGEHLKVVANFSNLPFTYEDDTLPAQSLIIYEDGKKLVYTP